MNHIKDLVTPAQQEKARQAQCSTSFVDEQVIKQIFAKMLIRYPLLWAKQWEDDRMLKLGIEDWLQTLCKLTEEQITLGLSKVSGQYPPNAGEFKTLCLEKPPYYAYHKDCETPEMAELPHLKSDEKTGRAWMEKIKKMIP